MRFIDVQQDGIRIDYVFLLGPFVFQSFLLVRISFRQRVGWASPRKPFSMQEFSQSFAGHGDAITVVHIGLKDLRIPRRSDVPAQPRGCRGQHEALDLFLLFFGEKRLPPRDKIPMKQEFKAAFVKQRHIMGNGLAAHIDHGGRLFAQISFHDQGGPPSPVGEGGHF